MKHKQFISAAVIAAITLFFTGCANEKAQAETNPTPTITIAPDSDSGSTDSSGSQNTGTVIDTSDLFSNKDIEVGYEQSEAISISLNGSSASCSDSSVSINGSVITIGAEGVYVLSGTLTNGQIIIDAPKTDKIRLILNGAEINCDTSAAIYVRQADKVFLTLDYASKNVLSNKSEFVAIDDNSIDAVIFSKEDLTINGKGSLTIQAAYGHGIVCKDELAITGGSFTITAQEHGISGKDIIKISEGSFTIVSGKDGLHSENKDNTTLGSIYIGSGSFTITAQGDALDAAAALQIDDGTFTLITGGGSEKTAEESTSSKGLKSAGGLTINQGSFTIDSSDDAVHTNGTLIINNGTYVIATSDDGIHADAALTIRGGDINITKSYEGIEGKSIEILEGTIQLISSDDGLNAADGSSSSTGSRPGKNATSSSDCFITISGGHLTIDASGDGIDSNGSLTITGGEIYVSGPLNSGNAALDYDTTATISGGLIVAAGYSGMAQGFDSSSEQGFILYSISSNQTGEIQLKSGSTTLVSYTPAKQYNNVLISLPGIKQGETYSLVMGSETQTVTMEQLSYSNSSGFGGFGGGFRGGSKPENGTMPDRGSMPDGFTMPEDGSRPGRGSNGDKTTTPETVTPTPSLDL